MGLGFESTIGLDGRLKSSPRVLCSFLTLELPLLLLPQWGWLGGAHSMCWANFTIQTVSKSGYGRGGGYGRKKKEQKDSTEEEEEEEEIREREEIALYNHI